MRASAPAMRPVSAQPVEPRPRLRHSIREALLAGCDQGVGALAGWRPRLAERAAEQLRRSLLARWMDLAEWRVRAPGVAFAILEQRPWVQAIEDPSRWGAMTGVDCEGRYEAAFFESFRRHAAAARVIVDAGAARGLYTLLATHTEAVGVIHAFEPDRGRRLALRMNVLRAQLEKRVVIRREMLGAMNAGGMVTLDRYCERAGIAPDLVKVDIEGAEIELLEGARRVCLENRPTLLIEFHARRLRAQGRNPERVIELLDEYGYRVRFNGHHGALEKGGRRADLEWRREAPNENLTAILAKPE